MAKIRNPLTYMGGGSPTPPTPQPLDPEQVYRDTRPADWLVMPEPEAETIYLLLMIDKDAVDNQYFSWRVRQTTGGTATAEFGTTDAQGNFTADPALTLTTASTFASVSTFLPVAAFGNPTSEGLKQLVCRLHSTSSFTGDFIIEELIKKRLFEIKGRASCNGGIWLGGSSNSSYAYNLRYFSMKDSSFTQATFQNGCPKLKAVLSLGMSTTSWTNASNMFSGCASLTAIPQLSTGKVTNFSNMFADCSSLTTIPLLDTSSGTNFSNMFQNCYALATIPLLDTGSGTNFSNMFQNCYSLTAIPQLDTSSGTNFQSMFRGCYSLTSADLTGYDFSSITNNTAMNTFFIFAPPATYDFGDEWSTAGVINSSAILSPDTSLVRADTPIKVRINKTDAMLPIAVNATTLFSNNQYVYVYVPDALLATYQADTYWATLGTRLKPMSEWSA